MLSFVNMLKEERKLKLAIFKYSSLQRNALSTPSPKLASASLSHAAPHAGEISANETAHSRAAV